MDEHFYDTTFEVLAEGVKVNFLLFFLKYCIIINTLLIIVCTKIYIPSLFEDSNVN